MEHQTSMFRGQPDTYAIKAIQFWENYALQFDPRGYCVCTSEGKDSRVLGHLMRRAGVKHFYVHNRTGIDPPPLIYFQQKNFQAYRDAGYITHDIKPMYTMWQLIRKKRMLPLRQKRFCCQFLKESRTEEQGRAVLSLGVRRHESRNRMNTRGEFERASSRGTSEAYSFDNVDTRKEFEDCRTAGERRVNPIAEWTNEDIWNYSRDVGLEHCSLYSEGLVRLGCIACPMAGSKTRRMELERWPGFKKLYLRAIEQVIHDRKALGLTVFTDGQTAEEWLEWWLSDRASDEVDDAQLDIWNWESDDYYPNPDPS